MGVILGIQCSVIHVGHCTDGQIPLLCSYIFVQTQAPTPLKSPPSPHRLYDLQDTLDKLMHFLPQLSDFVPLTNRFCSFRAHTNITLLTLIATLFQGESPTYILNEDTQPVIRAIGVSHSLQRWVSTESSISQLECTFIFVTHLVSKYWKHTGATRPSLNPILKPYRFYNNVEKADRREGKRGFQKEPCLARVYIEQHRRSPCLKLDRT